MRVTARDLHGLKALVTDGADGLGIDGGLSATTLDRDFVTGRSEVLRFGFDKPMDSVTLRLSQMALTADGYAEIAVWRAFDANGNLVGRGLLDPRGHAAVGTDTYEFTIDPDIDFTRLVISARAPAGTSGLAKAAGDGFSIASLAYTEAPADVAAGLVVVESNGGTAVTEGGASDSLTVALASAPTSVVTVTLSGTVDLNLAGPGSGAATATTLTFTPENWSTPQAVTVTAVNDGQVEPTETVGISFTTHSSDSHYEGLGATPVSVTVTDAPNPVLPAGPPAGAIIVHVGDSLAALVKAAPAGATFWIEAGEHRLDAVTPKAGQTFIGEDGAILNGSRELTTFTHTGSTWYADGQTQEGWRVATGEALPGYDRAGYPDAVYFDDHPLLSVGSLAKVTHGTYYFDYAANRIYLGDDPKGHSVEAAVSPYAFSGGATGVTIDNLIVEKYASPIQHGAIGGDTLPQNWTIQNVEVRLNYGVGINVGSGTKVLDSNIHDNGNMGVGGNGSNILFDGNEIASNGFWSGIDTYWEGGGSKFAETTNLVVSNNYVHDNNGYGLWTDINNIGTLYEGNMVVRNLGAGINHEISYDAIIRNNTLIDNGEFDSDWLWGGGIQIQNSQNVEIYGNTVDMTNGGNGITLLQQDRGTGSHGAWVTANNHVHDNIIISRTPDHGSVGAIADYNKSQMLAAGNTFDYNEYHVTSAAAYRFFWVDDYNWSGFHTSAHQEAHGTLVLL